MRIKVTIVLLTLFLLVGCQDDALTDYSNAVQQTGEIAKGQWSWQMSLEQTFNEEGLTGVEITSLKKMEDVAVELEGRFDHEVLQSEVYGYINVQRAGYDFTVYQNDNEIIIRLPIIGKYLLLSNLQIDEASKSSDEQAPVQFYESITQPAGQYWLDIMRQEDVVKSNKKVVTTPEGDIKVTQFNITMHTDQILDFCQKVLALIKDNASLLDSYLPQNFEFATEEATTVDSEAMLAILTEMLEHVTQIEVRGECNIDMDGYITDETYTVHIETDFQTPGAITTQDITIHAQNWDIGKEQEIKRPELTATNSLELDDLTTWAEGSGNLFQFNSKEQ